MKFFTIFLWMLFFKQNGHAQDSLSVSADQILKIVQNNSGIIIDVRTPEEYHQGHLKNSILIDFLSSNFMEKIQELDTASAYYLYCRSGNRSNKAAALMRQHGFKCVYNVKDGFEKLKQSGLPTESNQ